MILTPERGFHTDEEIGRSDAAAATEDEGQLLNRGLVAITDLVKCLARIWIRSDGAGDRVLAVLPGIVP
jgi:hypothetical protein